MKKTKYSKLNLYLSLVALCLALVILIITLSNSSGVKPVETKLISPVGIGSNMPVNYCPAK